MTSLIIASRHPARRGRLAAVIGAFIIALTALITAPGVSRADTSLPCDIYAAAGTPCVAAHSSVRALISGYDGPLYQLTRNTDGATHDVGVLSPGGYANAADHDAFCGTASCTITRIYDQTPRHNDLALAPAGQQGSGASHGADAGTLAVTAGGHKAYGVWITQRSGYRYTGAASGVATNGQPEGVYMVASGTHTNAGCCFDYGNAEAQPVDTHAGHMDAVSLETKCYVPPCTGQGPWVQADMEDGLFQGGNGSDTANSGNSSSFVTAMLKNDGQTTYALKGGDARSGALNTWWSGRLPNGYAPMHQEGGIILGIGGDNSNYDVGTFFEGVMTAGYPSDAADTAVQANIASVGYSGQTAVPNSPHSIQAGATATILDNNKATVVYALGSDGWIYENYQTIPGGGGWSGWELNLGTAGGPFVSAPSVFVDSAGKTVVTAVDASGNVEENYQQAAAAGPWSGWHLYNNSPLPAGVRFIGTPFATHDANGVNVTYATGTDGNVYEDYFTRSTGLWSGWELNLGAGGPFVSSPSVFSDSTGHLVVTALDSSGNLQEDYQKAAGGSPWSGWHNYSNSPLPAGITFAGMPNSLRDKNGTNITYVLGSDGKVYENYLLPQGWFGWELALGSAPVSFGVL